MSKNIPTKINNYNVYNEGEKLLGVGDELTLPDFEATSETVSGAGILGEIDDPTVGYFGNQELEIPFRLLDKETADMTVSKESVRMRIFLLSLVFAFPYILPLRSGLRCAIFMHLS